MSSKIICAVLRGVVLAENRQVLKRRSPGFEASRAPGRRLSQSLLECCSISPDSVAAPTVAVLTPSITTLPTLNTPSWQQMGVELVEGRI
jgi:uncharacterized circularly permuted ATP-grasp superfamily protein